MKDGSAALSDTRMEGAAFCGALPRLTGFGFRMNIYISPLVTRLEFTRMRVVRIMIKYVGLVNHPPLGIDKEFCVFPTGLIKYIISPVSHFSAKEESFVRISARK